MKVAQELLEFDRTWTVLLLLIFSEAQQQIDLFTVRHFVKNMNNNTVNYKDSACLV